MYADGLCEALVCQFQSVKVSIIVVYRPPNVPKDHFDRVIKWIRSVVDEVDNSYSVVIVGDFNFPYIDWNSGKVNGGVPVDMQQSAENFLYLLSDLFMTQYVSLPTRSNNILDLFFTNNPYLVTNVAVSDTELSDHRMVDVILSIETDVKVYKSDSAIEQNNFKCLDFSKANFNLLNTKFLEVPWEELFEDTEFEDFPSLFTMILLQICVEHVPIKKQRNGKPKIINSLRRKKKRTLTKLDALKRKNGSLDHINALNSKIALITFEIKEAVHRELDSKECAAIRRIKENPKSFYNFAKSHSSIKSDLAMLFSEDSNVVTDRAEISNILQRQFSSVFSNPFSPDIGMYNFFVPNIISEIREDQLCITDQDILTAIGDIKRSSAAGPDRLPAVLLKECAPSLVTPIKLIWQLSLKEGIVPNFYKKSHVHPLFKKGDRVRAENYRPVSMKSHIVKVCERILRKIIVNYLENNKILTHNQHSFRSGRNTLTHLLAHCDDICDRLRNHLDTDFIYLDYPFAFIY